MLFCKHKLTVQEVSDLQRILEDVSYSCQSTLEDLDMPGRLTNVFVKDHGCADGLEKLYYSCGFVSTVHQKMLTNQLTQNFYHNAKIVRK